MSDWWGSPEPDEPQPVLGEPQAEIPPTPEPPEPRLDPEGHDYGWGNYPEWPPAGPSSSDGWDYGYRPAEAAPTVPERR